MNYILFDDATRNELLPFTHTRPVADIRCGILTMRERWERLLTSATSTLPFEPYLSIVFPTQYGPCNTYVNASVFGTPDLAQLISELAPGQAVFQGALLLAVCSEKKADSWTALQALATDKKVFGGSLMHLKHNWDIFNLNDAAIRADFTLLTQNRSTQPLPTHVTAIGAEQIFIEPGAQVSPCIINASTGPVYVSEDAQIMEGCMLRGPVAIGKHAALKMGAKVYGATTIGDGCKVGGEVSNVVFFANSNKGHDGFLGNSVVGEWCNFGADSNCSNLKNNYDIVAVWNEYEGISVKTGLQFCGLMMADHSKCGINTMFNTGTIAGVSCNIFGGGFPDKFIPSFSWGGSDSMTTYAFEKAMDTARRMMMRRGITLSKEAEDMYRHIFEKTAVQRQDY